MEIKDNPELRDSFSVKGNLKDFMQPGFEAPTFGETGAISGVIRIASVDPETNTLWLESVPNASR